MEISPQLTNALDGGAKKTLNHVVEATDLSQVLVECLTTAQKKALMLLIKLRTWVTAMSSNGRSQRATCSH